MNELDILLRIFIAAILGGLVGFERELHGRVAGLRTHILVSVGSALIMLTSIEIFNIYNGIAQVDPSRIAAQVVSGIGFLGAGTILRFRASVRGLTTAASLWTVAGIGLACGIKFYNAAFITTAVVLISLLFFAKLEHLFIRKDWYKVLLVESKGNISELRSLREILSEFKVEIKDLAIEKMEGKDTILTRMSLKLLNEGDEDAILSAAVLISGVEKAKWE